VWTKVLTQVQFSFKQAARFVATKCPDPIDGSIIISYFVPLSGYNPGLIQELATLASIKKTIVVNRFSEFFRKAISAEKTQPFAQTIDAGFDG